MNILGAEEVFAKINYPFMGTKFRKLGIERKFFNPIKATYQNNTPEIKKMSIFLLWAWMGKRYPQSPLPVNITLVDSASAIRQEKDIKIGKK